MKQVNTGYVVLEQEVFTMNTDLLTLMETRRSVRSFKPDMIPSDVINQIIKAGTYAATGMNRQSPIIIAVTNKEMRDRLSRMNAKIMGSDKDPFYGAPIVLIVLAKKETPTHVYDGSLVMGNLMLAAHAVGVDSCWIHRAKEEFASPEGKALLKEWGLSENYVGIGHCILGYRDCEYPEAKERKADYIVRV